MRFDYLCVLDDFGVKAGGANYGGCWQTDEGIATEAFTAFDRLQQKAIFAAIGGLREFQVEGQWRFQIGKGFSDHRDTIVALCGQGFKFEFSHDVCALNVFDRRMHI